MKKLIYILFICFGSLLNAQEKSIEKQTSDLFLLGDWQSLIDLSTKINNNHFGTYEIEYRLAVAYYSTGNYFDSAQQFEHIIYKYKINDEIVLEYLYYSYLFSGRQQDALLVAEDFPFHLQVKTDAKKFKFFDYLSAEGGLKLSSAKDQGVENLAYLNAGLGQQLGYRLKLQHAYTNISQDYIDLTYKQNEYYGAFRYQMAKGLTLTPSYHYVTIVENNLSTYTDNNDGMNSGYDESNPSTTIETKTNIFHIALKKQWNRFFISPNFIYINTKNDEIGKFDKIQYGLNAGLNIKATKDKLWIGGGFDILATNYDNSVIWNIKAYYGIGSKAYILVRYLGANTSDFTQEDGMYYYNAISTMKNNVSTTFSYNFSPKFSWYINYQLENVEDTEYNFSFSYNTIITGIKFYL